MEIDRSILLAFEVLISNFYFLHSNDPWNLFFISLNSQKRKKKGKCIHDNNKIHDSTTRKPVERKSIFSVCRVSIDDIINYHVKLLFLFNDLSLNTVMKTGFSTFFTWKTSYGSLLTLTRELSMQEVRTNRENEKLWNYN